MLWPEYGVKHGGCSPGVLSVEPASWVSSVLKGLRGSLSVLTMIYAYDLAYVGFWYMPRKEALSNEC